MLHREIGIMMPLILMAGLTDRRVRGVAACRLQLPA
jgi:hypothetical protein